MCDVCVKCFLEGPCYQLARFSLSLSSWLSHTHTHTHTHTQTHTYKHTHLLFRIDLARRGSLLCRENVFIKHFSQLVINKFSPVARMIICLTLSNSYSIY